MWMTSSSKRMVSSDALKASWQPSTVRTWMTLCRTSHKQGAKRTQTIRISPRVTSGNACDIFVFDRNTSVSKHKLYTGLRGLKMSAPPPVAQRPGKGIMVVRAMYPYQVRLILYRSKSR